MLKIEQTLNYEINSICFHMRNLVDSNARDEMAAFVNSQILFAININFATFDTWLL
jgi:hypothetical protein